jgi:PII-like signaling protein
VEIGYNGVLMRIYVSESHRFRGKPLFRALMEAMLAAGFSGATAFPGAEGYGEGRRLSSDKAVEAPGDLPIVIEVAESEERLRGFLPALESMLGDGFVTVERVAVARYRSGHLLDR